jgi:hypothetical protein
MISDHVVPLEYSNGRVDLPLLAACLALRWLAGRLPLKIVYLLMRWLFGLVVLASRGDRGKDAELFGAPARERGAAPEHRPGAV